MSGEITLPELDWRPATMELDRRETLGQDADPADAELGDRITIGGPQTSPITPNLIAGDDEVVRELTRQLTEFRYHLVVLGATFQPHEDEEFEKAWVQIQLTSAAPNADTPTAWSMLPGRSVSPVTITQKTGVSAKIQLVGAEAEASREYAREDVFIDVLNLLGNKPTWVFSQTKSVAVAGSHRLLLIVQAPAGAEAFGEVHLRTVLRRRRLMVFSYRVRLDDQAGKRFVLKPSS